MPISVAILVGVVYFVIAYLVCLPVPVRSAEPTHETLEEDTVSDAAIEELQALLDITRR